MSRSVGLCHESGWTFISQTLHVQLGPYAIPVFSPCLQTVIHYELIMVLRVNQAWGGGVEGGVEGLWKDIGLCWASGLSPPCGNTMHQQLTPPPQGQSSLNSNLLLIAHQLLVQTDLVV